MIVLISYSTPFDLDPDHDPARDHAHDCDLDADHARDHDHDHDCDRDPDFISGNGIIIFV